MSDLSGYGTVSKGRFYYVRNGGVKEGFAGRDKTTTGGQEVRRNTPVPAFLRRLGVVQRRFPVIVDRERRRLVGDHRLELPAELFGCEVGRLRQVRELHRVVEVVAAECKLTKKSAGEIIETVFTEVGNAVKKDTRFSYPGFGTWSLRSRKARKIRNPQTNEIMKLKASKTIGFRPAKELKKTL